MSNILKKAGAAIRNRGLLAVIWEGLFRSGYYHAGWNTTTSRYPYGTSVFDRDWDLLIILDTGRPDALRDLSTSRDWITEVGTIRSVGSTSPEWYLNTFTENYRDDLQDTALLSANIYAHRVLNEWTGDEDAIETRQGRGWPNWKQVPTDELAHFEQIQGSIDHYETLHSESSAMPHILTDRAISVGREVDWNRLIVHYTLPHLPTIANALDWQPGECSIEELMAGPSETRKLRTEEEGYRPYAYGEFNRSDAYDNYCANLELVLDYVEVLLQNMNADKVAISADHGEGLGEWGLWDHKHGFPFAPMRIVPWVETSSTDEGTYESRYDPPHRLPSEQERKEFLKQMGYL